MGNMTQRTLALGTGLLLAAVPATAWAQSAADKAVADTLFNEGKKLLGKNDSLACEKFEASLAKATQLGTQLALASCYERVGRTASAWGEFRAAASAAAKVSPVGPAPTTSTSQSTFPVRYIGFQFGFTSTE